ncbi:effector-associated constant component EACC1 [Streptomyces nitrosporeus]|nr:hypothetical protein [Streptomyces nitrosporeus]
MTVRAGDGGDEANGAAELLRWLRNEPRLKSRVGRLDRDGAPAGAMGPVVDAVVAVLEPGGVAAVFAGALVAWVQTRRGSWTVTVRRPDGTEISLSSSRARALGPEEAAALAEQLIRPPGDAEDTGPRAEDTGSQAPGHDG